MLGVQAAVTWSPFTTSTEMFSLEFLYLFHVAAKLVVGRLVDSVPVDWNFDLFIQLEDHNSIIDVSVTHTRTHTHCQGCRFTHRTMEEGRKEFLRIEMVDSRVNTQRVHPVPERSFFSGFTCTETSSATSLTQKTHTPAANITEGCEDDVIPPSMELQSMSWFSGLFRAGYLLNRLATKAKLSLGLPRTTSAGMTNCLQPRRSAWSSMHSARFMSSFSCGETEETASGNQSDSYLQTIL